MEVYRPPVMALHIMKGTQNVVGYLLLLSP